MNLIKKLLLLLITLMVLVVLAGIYKFNIVGDDLYEKDPQGKWVPIQSD